MQGFDGENERLIMEKEALSQEKVSLEAQLSASQAQLKTFEETLEKLALQVFLSPLILGLSNLLQ